MWYEVRVFHCARSVDHPKEYEDAFAASLDGIAAISDGVASAIFSSVWSKLLVESAVEFRPNFSDSVGFADWLSILRNQWSEKIDFGALNYFQKMKLQRVGGAFATLMTLDFRFEGDEGVYDCQVFGDCCLFHERNGELIAKFPMEVSSDFQGAPSSLGSTDQGMDDQLELSVSSGTFRVGDRFFMTTDAIGEWIYKELENSSIVDWDEFASMDQRSWQDFVVKSRNRTDGFTMTVDDSTMMVIEIISKPGLETTDESDDGAINLQAIHDDHDVDQLESHDFLPEVSSEEEESLSVESTPEGFSDPSQPANVNQCHVLPEHSAECEPVKSKQQPLDESCDDFNIQPEEPRLTLDDSEGSDSQIIVTTELSDGNRESSND